ncbi:hypothetical protein GCM10007423_39780 [Dyadobacter endophyticus]|uniref:Uncharacterized protein n=1 Tax=Dyadobacter endophyticus TaxID=1749036 RepID=A0ABQ1Z082_9BACT|nr:hypothetical protein [Dyadobacter endophyticus]GGH42839.1 hypothetical protein GCM10007423_39780 [Dyadobacter endophyticus]
MRDAHWKIIAGLLVVILALACILWYRGFRQPTPNPEAPSFADTIRENKRRADRNADTAKSHQQQYEINHHKYVRWDSLPSGRDSLGARIYRDAQAKDSLRSRTP